MRRPWSLLLLLVAAASAQPSPQELEHFRLLKALRAKGFTCPNGQTFPPNAADFSFDCRAWSAARAHSEDMAARGYFSHVNPEGKDPCERTRARGLQACSENIAAGQATPQAALDAFKASANHCPNMLDPALNRVGVGFASRPGTKYTHYWTQAMGTDGSLDASCVGGAPAPPPGCRDTNSNCAAFKGYAGTQWCSPGSQGGWAATNCPKTCGLC